MKDMMLKLSVQMQSLMMSEEGQDLIEYALIASVVAMAAVAGMGTLATDINTAFTNIGAKLVTYTG